MAFYLKKTGTKWPYGEKWWSLKETLQAPFIITKGPAFPDFLESKQDSSILTILMTGRNTWCSNNVLQICQDHGADPHMFIFKPNHVYDTARYKIEVLKQILFDYTSLTNLFMWDDRQEHTILFQGLEDRFAKKRVKFGIYLCDPIKNTCKLLPLMEETKNNINKEIKMETNKEVCKFYLKGTCKFGDKCNKFHVEK